MNTHYFYSLADYPRSHGDLVWIGQALGIEDAIDVAKYQARRSCLTIELTAVQADSSDEAVKKFNDGEGVVVCRITAETTYKIERL